MLPNGFSLEASNPGIVVGATVGQGRGCGNSSSGVALHDSTVSHNRKCGNTSLSIEWLTPMVDTSNAIVGCWWVAANLHGDLCIRHQESTEEDAVLNDRVWRKLGLALVGVIADDSAS